MVWRFRDLTESRASAPCSWKRLLITDGNLGFRELAHIPLHSLTLVRRPCYPHTRLGGQRHLILNLLPVSHADLLRLCSLDCFALHAWLRCRCQVSSSASLANSIGKLLCSIASLLHAIVYLPAASWGPRYPC